MASSSIKTGKNKTSQSITEHGGIEKEVDAKVQRSQRVLEIVGANAQDDEVFSPRTEQYVESLLPILDMYNFTRRDIKELCENCNYDDTAINDSVAKILEDDTPIAKEDWGTVLSKKEKKAELEKKRIEQERQKEEDRKEALRRAKEEEIKRRQEREEQKKRDREEAKKKKEQDNLKRKEAKKYAAQEELWYQQQEQVAHGGITNDPVVVFASKHDFHGGKGKGQAAPPSSQLPSGLDSRGLGRSGAKGGKGKAKDREYESYHEYDYELEREWNEDNGRYTSEWNGGGGGGR